MNKVHRFFFVVALSLNLFACAEPAVDSTSEESLEDSIAEIRDDLSEEEQTSFDEALETLTSPDPYTFPHEDVQPIELSSLGGLTAKEVIARGDALAERREARRVYAIEYIENEIAEQRAELKKLKAEAATYESNAERIDKLLDIVFTDYQSTDTNGRDELRVEYDVINHSVQDISRILVGVSLTLEPSVDEQKVWTDKSSLSLNPPLKPGDTYSTWWLLADWRWPEITEEDLPFTELVIKPVALVAPNGEAFIDTRVPKELKQRIDNYRKVINETLLPRVHQLKRKEQ